MSDSEDLGPNFMRTSVSAAAPAFGPVFDVKNIETHIVFAASKGESGGFKSVPLVSVRARDQEDAIRIDHTYSMVDVLFLATVYSNVIVEVREAITGGASGPLQGADRIADLLRNLSDSLRRVADEADAFASEIEPSKKSS